ncbi:MAG: permease-like cell division protein FtsX [bacterium]
MFLLSIARSVWFAFQSFWRNIWLSLVTIFIIFLALISINFLVVLNAISDLAIKAVKDRVDISVYFKPEVQDSKIAEIKNQLSTVKGVKTIDYNSPQQNLQSFKERHASESVIQESLTELAGNPLGATLVIKAKDLKDYPAILQAVDNPDYTSLIEDKSYDDHQVVISKINGITDSVRKGGLIVSLVFIIIAILIVFNTVRITIFTHKNEVSIMKLVGAGNWFVRAPFIIEIIISGVVACVLSTLVVYVSLAFAQPYLSSFFDGANFDILGYFNANFLIIFGTQLAGIIILNVISSSIALRRYLKV